MIQSRFFFRTLVLLPFLILSIVTLTAPVFGADNRAPADADGPFLRPDDGAPAFRPPPAFSPLNEERGPAGEPKPNVIFVRFRKGVDETDAAGIHHRYAAAVVRKMNAPSLLQVVAVPEGLTAEELVVLYQKEKSVLYAEGNQVGQVEWIPNDPSFSTQWSLHNTGQHNGVRDVDLNIPEAWDAILRSAGSNVYIGVVDTGVDYNHVDLRGNMWRNPGETKNGKDDDGNGYVDDIYGINAIHSTGDPMDVQGHGTHVAGIIAATTDNGKGIAGIAPNAKIIACRAGDANGHIYSGAVAQCLDYFYTLKTRKHNPVNIVATNHSWKGSGYSQALHDAIRMQLEAGILLVGGSGNDTQNMDPTFGSPMGHDAPNLISVAATDFRDAIASFSNYGSQTITVGAPGVNIYSTYPGDRYANGSGTSFSGPHVTGLVALIAGHHPEKNWAEIRNLVLAGAKETPAMKGKTITGRRIRAWDTDGSGSLSCRDRVLVNRLKPQDFGGEVYFPYNSPLVMSALHINCDKPNGNLAVGIEPGARTTTLRDTGLGADEVADDGQYSGGLQPGQENVLKVDMPGGKPFTAYVLDNYAPAEVGSGNYRNISGTKLDFSQKTVQFVDSPFPIRFANPVKGQRYIAVSRFGFLSFNLGDRLFNNRMYGNGPSTNLRINEHALQQVIAPLWDAHNAGTVHWATLGSAPHRELVIEWRDVSHAQCGNNARFQVVFHEGKPDIRFNYTDVMYGDDRCDNGASATVGIAVSSDAKLGQAFSYNAARLNNGTSLLWRLAARPEMPIDDDADLGEPTGTEDGDSADADEESLVTPPAGKTGGSMSSADGGGCASAGRSTSGLLLLMSPIALIALRRRILHAVR